MLDQPGRPRRDQAGKRLQPGGNVVLRVDRLAHVVQQRRQQEFLVVRQFLASQLEHLKTVVEDVALGMRLQVLLDVFQGQQQGAASVEAVGAPSRRRAGRRLDGLGDDFGEAAQVLAAQFAPVGAGQGEHLLVDLTPGRQVASPDALLAAEALGSPRSGAEKFAFLPATTGVAAASKAICRRRFSLGMGSCVAMRDSGLVVSRRGEPLPSIPDRLAVAAVLDQAHVKKRGRSAFFGNTERPSSARATLEHDCADLRWALVRAQDVAVDKEAAVVGHRQHRHPAVSGDRAGSGRCRRDRTPGRNQSSSPSRPRPVRQTARPRKPSSSAACTRRPRTGPACWRSAR